ncbi:hypothetical protein VNO77_28886 [Canavalia gladiata]|uniref:Uncharacterized protein n=1 Tax=Canavalia gladiata TaxID=3824 RepID=A0AAN9KX64_CANGL
MDSWCMPPRIPESACHALRREGLLTLMGHLSSQVSNLNGQCCQQAANPPNIFLYNVIIYGPTLNIGLAIGFNGDCMAFFFRPPI